MEATKRMGRNKNKHRKEKERKWRKRAEQKTNPSAQVSINREKFQAAAPDLRNKIDKAIQRLLEIGRQFDPLPILSETAVNRLFRDPEARAPSREIGEAECEHLASLFLSQPFPAIATPPTPERPRTRLARRRPARVGQSRLRWRVRPRQSNRARLMMK